MNWPITVKIAATGAIVLLLMIPIARAVLNTESKKLQIAAGAVIMLAASAIIGGCVALLLSVVWS